MRFLGGAECPPKVFADVAALSPAGPEKLAQAAQKLLAWLARETDAELADIANGFASAEGSDGVSAAQWREGSGALLFFFQGCVREQVAVDAVAEDLEQLGLGGEAARAIAAVWKQKVRSSCVFSPLARPFSFFVFPAAPAFLCIHLPPSPLCSPL
jgi:COMMD2-7/10, HN domain